MQAIFTRVTQSGSCGTTSEVLRPRTNGKMYLKWTQTGGNGWIDKCGVFWRLEDGKFNLFYCLHVFVTSHITCTRENGNIKLSEAKKGLKAHSRPGGVGNAQICCPKVEVEEPQTLLSGINSCMRMKCNLGLWVCTRDRWCHPHLLSHHFSATLQPIARDIKDRLFWWLAHYDHYTVITYPRGPSSYSHAEVRLHVFLYFGV